MRTPDLDLLAAAVLAFVLALFWLNPAAARADVEFGTSGSGAGETSNPEGVAVDISTGLLYVADRGNNRVDVFEEDGTFVMAFGWGVADGESAELQTCTTTCFAGLQGGGAGQFRNLTGITVDSAAHLIYTFDNQRVQEFNDSGEFLRAWGGGVISGAASASATLASGSAVLTNVVVTKGAFEEGQTVTGSGIPAETRIVELGAGTMTLSNPVTATGSRIVSVAEGPGNVPVNEIQEFTIGSDEFSFIFSTPDPMPTEDSMDQTLPKTATAAEVQAGLESLSNIAPGDVLVTGSAGGPFTIEFSGRYADTNVAQLTTLSYGGANTIATLVNGHSSPAICTAAIASSCTGGAPGSAAGQFSQAGGSQPRIGVNGSGEVLVLDSVPVDPGSTDAFTPRVQKFNSAGTQLAEFDLAGFESKVRALAVAVDGTFYVANVSSDSEIGAVRKYSAAGTCLNCGDPLESSFNLSALAVDSAANLYIANLDEAGRMISMYDSGENQLRVFGYGQLVQPANGLAAYSSAFGDLFASQGVGSNSSLLYFSLPEPGPVVPPIDSKVVASPVRSTKATLNGFVNPEGTPTTYYFEYVESATYEADITALGAGHGFDHAVRLPADEADDPALPGDFDAHAVSAQATGLTPETGYRFRLVAVNGEGEDSFEGEPFETLEPVELRGTWVTKVQDDAAVLNGALNPFGSPTTGFFEYVDDATYKADVESLGPGHGFDHAIQAPPESSPLDFGEGEEPQTRSVEISSLDPETVYHYRLKVTDPFVTVFSGERRFSTSSPDEEGPESCPNSAVRIGVSKFLPDCRAYELVSPVDKDGGEILALPNVHGDPTEYDRTSPDGDRMAFVTYRAIGDAESSPWSSQYVADRGSTGWTSRALSPPRGPSFYGGIFDNEYVTFTADLCQAWIRHDAEPRLSPAAPEGFPGLYRADICSTPTAYEALNEVVPDVEPMQFQPEVQGISDNGEITVFRVQAKLTNNALSGRYQLYASRAGKLRLLCIQPNGLPIPQECSAGTANESANFGRRQTVDHAVSDDGTRIFWTASANQAGPGKIFLRLNPFGSGGECSKPTAPCTIPVSDAAESLSSTTSSRFWTAAVDGSVAVFTSGEDLYRFEVEGKSTTRIARKVKGVVDASDDASRIYFVSEEAGAAEEGEGATKGGLNLYLYSKDDGISFVATLLSIDLSVNLPTVVVTPDPLRRTAATTPDGLRLVFTSAAQLTEYDNTDAISREPAQEVYIFDSTAPPGNKLRCVSCDPHGASPEAREVLGVNGAITWISASLPVWQDQLYLPHYLSDSGARLFFQSIEGLLSRDTNGKQDVYEWQAGNSKEDCRERQAGAYVASAGGCLGLISAGTGENDSQFLDADPQGINAFFATMDSLVPQDFGARDIYDARIGGGFPPPDPGPVPCEGEACQGPAGTPPGTTPPASNTFHGSETTKAKHKKKHKKKKHRRSKRRHHKAQHRGAKR